MGLVDTLITLNHESHVPLIININIQDINININIQSIKKYSEEEKNFVNSIIQGIENLNISSIRSREDLQNLVQQLATIFENAWHQHSKLRHITKHSRYGGVKTILTTLTDIPN